ncbi:hypothetical protein ACVWZA_003520 [Sphingomonas sp. UYAg733]
MATVAQSVGEPTRGAARESRLFLIMAFVMAGIIVAGFSLQLAMGRSSFASPLVVHVHAVVFMGWVVLYLLQNVFAANGSMALHRRLGWIGAVWMVAMVVLGTMVTVLMVRRGQAPFFFLPAQFLVFNSLSILTFAGLTTAAIMLRRQTEWHRRLHYCGMALLLGPAFGRLLPMPLLKPYANEVTFIAIMLFPLIGIAADLRRTGRVHPAWLWGIGTIVGLQLVIESLPYSSAGAALYRVATAGTPGAAMAPLDYPPPPTGPLITGRAPST